MVGNSSAFADSARVQDLFGGNVIIVVNGTADASDDARDGAEEEEEEEGSVVYLLLKMHAGLWTLCVDLTGQNSRSEREGGGGLAKIN